ncbi:hypothetical protein [Dolichospermum phage Dfl-JY45]
MQNVRNLRNRIQGKQKQKGFSLLELIVVLVIIVILGVAIYANFGTARSGALTQQATQGALGIVSAISRNFPNPSYGANNADLVQTIVKQAPKNLVNTATTPNTLRDPWGNAITVVASNSGANYLITFAGVPAEECNPFVRAVADNFRAVSVGATEVKAAGAALNTATLDTACNAASGTVAVALTGA